MGAINPYVALIHDYQDVIFPFQTKPEPEIFFGKPVLVDLGCGAGNFCIKYAAKYPATSVIGLEVRYKRLVLAARKAKKHQLDNVKFIQSKVEAFTDFIPPKSVTEVNCNFPDPWPKRRMRKNRFLNPALFQSIHACLTDTGCFRFKTDFENYYAEVLEWLSGSTLFTVIEQTEDYQNSAYFEPDLVSEFEALFYSKQMPVYYLLAQKKTPHKCIK